MEHPSNDGFSACAQLCAHCVVWRTCPLSVCMYGLSVFVCLWAHILTTKLASLSTGQHRLTALPAGDIFCMSRICALGISTDTSASNQAGWRFPPTMALQAVSLLFIASSLGWPVCISQVGQAPEGGVFWVSCLPKAASPCHSWIATGL